jgi:ATP-binding cassette subfamily F protein uup
MTKSKKRLLKKFRKKLRAKGKMGFNEKREIGQLEVEVPRLEKRKAELTEELEAVVDDHEKLMKISAEFQRVSDELEEKEFRWLELSELDG